MGTTVKGWPRYYPHYLMRRLMQVKLMCPAAGLHWHYRTRSHASELTAGYFNCEGRDGYRGLVDMCRRHGVSITLTCVEMCDSQHPPQACCGPEGLLRQVRAADSILIGPQP